MFRYQSPQQKTHSCVTMKQGACHRLSAQNFTGLQKEAYAAQNIAKLAEECALLLQQNRYYNVPSKIFYHLFKTVNALQTLKVATDIFLHEFQKINQDPNVTKDFLKLFADDESIDKEISTCIPMLKETLTMLNTLPCSKAGLIKLMQYTEGLERLNALWPSKSGKISNVLEEHQSGTNQFTGYNF
ncbi:MAG: hypothetical protein RLZ12_379 [Bacillota bacterium]